MENWINLRTPKYQKHKDINREKTNSQKFGRLQGQRVKTKIWEIKGKVKTSTTTNKDLICQYSWHFMVHISDNTQPFGMDLQVVSCERKFRPEKESFYNGVCGKVSDVTIYYILLHITYILYIH